MTRRASHRDDKWEDIREETLRESLQQLERKERKVRYPHGYSTIVMCETDYSYSTNTFVLEIMPESLLSAVGVLFPGAFLPSLAAAAEILDWELRCE
ncbi:hypothetical protein Y032_0072g648 [Ancylostoma ceylanicum]|nr:hypothetical protein Y032_0072g648 [Ancylostoma ceylanicum]